MKNVSPGSHSVDREFIPWRIPASNEAANLCRYICKEVESYERENSLRKRKRKPTDQKAFEKTVTTLVCDLLHHVFVRNTSEEGGIHISLSHRHLGTSSRYNAPVMTKALPGIVKSLAACGFLTFSKGHKAFAGLNIPARQTVIKPTTLLLDLATGKHTAPDGSRFAKIGIADIGQDCSGGEAILLRSAKAGLGSQRKSKAIPYKDTKLTHKLRKEMNTINDWLAKAPVKCALSSWRDEEDRHQLIDPARRFLRRIFTRGSFKYGGRLYGGFWQEMPSGLRSRHITIAGEPVCSLDYGQMAPRILYRLEGTEPPQEDCYALPGYEHCREGMKQIFNAALFKNQEPKRFPRGVSQLFPPGTPFNRVFFALLEAHQPIRGYLFISEEIGHMVQNIESNIMTALLLRLREAGLPAALPVHDAVIVPQSCASTAIDCMQAVFLELAGIRALVRVQ